MLVVDTLFKGAVVASAHSTGFSVETVIIFSLIADPIGGVLIGFNSVCGVTIKKMKK